MSHFIMSWKPLNPLQWLGFKSNLHKCQFKLTKVFTHLNLTFKHSEDGHISAHGQGTGVKISSSQGIFITYMKGHYERGSPTVKASLTSLILLQLWLKRIYKPPPNFFRPLKYTQKTRGVLLW